MQTIETLNKKKLDNIFNELVNDAVSEGREITLIGAGGCMEPLLKNGDRVSFKKVDINKLKRLDLVILRNRWKNEFISHRFFKLVDNNGQIYIFTRSDVSREYDYPIAEVDYIGLVTKIQKPKKTIYLNTFAGRLRSYINIFIAPLYIKYIEKIKPSVLLYISKFKPKQKKGYFCNENKLLTLVSKINVDRHSLLGIKELLSQDLNWDYIFERIKWNFIAPFFSKDIIENELKDKIPSGIQERVKQICVWQLYHDKKVYLELKNVLSAFKSNNIKVMVIKGAHLGEEIYGDTFLRWMGDIDILAKTDDWSKIKSIFQGLNFKFSKTDYDDWCLNYLDNHIAFFKDSVRMELKFNLWAMDFPYFTNDLWQNGREILISGEKADAPSLEDTLLIACINLTRHNYAGLIWFSDIREIIERFIERINWDIVIRRAKEKDIDCMVYYALYYSSRLLNYEIPQDILKKLKPSFLKRKLHNFFWNEKIILWKKEGYPPRAKIAFEIAVLLFGGKLSLRPRKLLKMLLYISSVVMPKRTHLSTRYKISKNSPRIIFCYLLEPFRFFFMMLYSIGKTILAQ